jgi:hypothetical protein
MGQLGHAYSGIVAKNQQESLIAGTLTLINPTRVQLTHRRRNRQAEEAIRLAMGNHVHAATQCLEDILR